ncbi:Rv1733c family protein [Streptomyces sp. NPDC055055]
MSHQELPDPRPGVPGGSRPVGRAVLTLVLAVAVICGAVAAGMLWNAGIRADRALAAHRHQVQATATARAEEPPLATRQGLGPQSVAPAVWEYPDDVRRSGTIPVPPRTPQGRTVPLWVDDQGVPARPSGGTAALAPTAVAGGVAVTSVVGASGFGVLALARRRTEGRRLTAWEREWEQVEPVWSGRLRRGSGPGTGDA